MKIALYSPHLGTCGGGEKYLCRIAEFASNLGHNVDLITPEKNLDIKILEQKLNVRLEKVKIHKLKGFLLENILAKYIAIPFFVFKLSKKYDLFINQENNSIIPSRSKMSIYICQLPMRRANTSSFFKNILVAVLHVASNFSLKSYSKTVTYSFFNKRWIETWRKSQTIEVLYPPVDTKEFVPFYKDKVILSTGRFFIKGHNKKQRELIREFKDMFKRHSELRNWEFHLAGGVGGSSEDREYLEACKQEAKGYPIYFHIDATFSALKELYGRAKIFWHATGLGEECPTKMEHFGITTVEAMAAGCVPVVINKGGQPEIVRHGIDGFLWKETEELKGYTLELIKDEELWGKMSKESINRAQCFGQESFEKGLIQIMPAIY